MKQTIILMGAALALTACAGQQRPEPVIETVEVLIPDPYPCPRTEDIGEGPVFPDTVEALRNAPDLEARVRIVMAARELRIDRLQSVLNAIAICNTP